MILKKIDLKLNTNKCLLVSDDLHDFIIDQENGFNIMTNKNTNYLGQCIDNNGKAFAKLDGSENSENSEYSENTNEGEESENKLLIL